MAKLWTVSSKNALGSASLCEYSEDEVKKILDSARDYLICYAWSESKDNWDDERGSGDSSGILYFRISEDHVLVSGGVAIGVILRMKQENYGRFSSSYFNGNHCILFGDNKILNLNCSYYVGSTDVSEENRISLVGAKGFPEESISNGSIHMTGLDRSR